MTQQIKEQIERTTHGIVMELYIREPSIGSSERAEFNELKGVAIKAAAHVLSSPELYGLVADNVYKSAVNDRVEFRVALKTERDKTAELEAENKKLKSFFGLERPWPLTDVISKLIEASSALLHEHSYDGHKPGQIPYEDVNTCIEEAKSAVKRIKQALEGLSE